MTAGYISEPQCPNTAKCLNVPAPSASTTSQPTILHVSYLHVAIDITGPATCPCCAARRTHSGAPCVDPRLFGPFPTVMIGLFSMKSAGSSPKREALTTTTSRSATICRCRFRSPVDGPRLRSLRNTQTSAIVCAASGGSESRRRRSLWSASPACRPRITPRSSESASSTLWRISSRGSFSWRRGRADWSTSRVSRLLRRSIAAWCGHDSGPDIINKLYLFFEPRVRVRIRGEMTAISSRVS